ncbi:hypothetical protein ACER0A_000670 [Haloimpatiens sp. FM7315]|uniref:hypothetical protein n=1 Tax=Haloimpatiens sp. FM7315 TaxID=3298609 RepID=UPI00370B947E
MNNTFKNSFKVEFAQSANKLIYYLKKIPIIGKLFRDSLYKKTEIKLILGVIGKILAFIGGFLYKAFYLGIMILLPLYLITKDFSKIRPYFINIFFLLSFIAASFMKTSIFNSGNEKNYYMIKLMRVDAGEYLKSQLLYMRIIELINFSIPLMIIGRFINISPLEVLIILLELTAFRLMGECIYIIFYDKYNVNLENNNIFQGVLVITVLLASYLPSVFKVNLNFECILFNKFAEILILILGIVSLICIFKYKKYRVLSRRLFVKNNMIDMDKIKSDISFSDVKLDDKKISKESLKSKTFDNKKGYEYINLIFFSRFKKVIINPVKFRLYIIGIAFIALVIFCIVMPDKRYKIVDIFEKKPSIFIFIMYIMSTGQKICRALFYNCDVKLLRYQYYREKDAVLNSFKVRLKKIIILNIIPASALCACIIGIVIISGFYYKLLGMIPLLLCIICLSCFFSIHYLLLYYVIQPYTAELETKSPAFSIINWSVYIICYTCLKIKTSSYIFMLAVAFATIIYMVAALTLICRLSSKTFKLK